MDNSFFKVADDTKEYMTFDEDAAIKVSELPTPTGNRVFVEILREPEKIGSIYRPESKRRHHTDPYCGVVISVGQGKAYPEGVIKPVDVKPGDTVLWMYPEGNDGNWYNKPYADGYLSIGTRKLLIISEDDIIAKVEV